MQVPTPPRPTETAGLWYGFLGVASFSLTLPFTRLAVTAFDPVVVTLGRALVAAVLAGAALWLTRQPIPTRAQWRGLALTAMGVVLGFPLLTAWAMREVPAAHGAVVIGLLPLATAGFAALRAGERPSLAFWLTSLTGSFAVVGFALSTGAGGFHPADMTLLGATVAGAFGYAEGGRLARELGGWQVISWAVVLAAPFLVWPAVMAVLKYGLSGPVEAWLSFAYLGLVSQFAGFIVWYKGLAVGGVTRVSQLQLLQPFLTIVASALLLGEAVTLPTIGVALFVVATVAAGRRAPVARPGNSRG